MIGRHKVQSNCNLNSLAKALRGNMSQLVMSSCIPAAAKETRETDCESAITCSRERKDTGGRDGKNAVREGGKKGYEGTEK